MEKNEIKSYRLNISLKEYLLLDDIITTNTFQVGNIKYWKASTKLQCQHKEDNTVLQLLGQNAKRSSLYLFEISNGILECDIKDVIVYADVVLKETNKEFKIYRTIKFIQRWRKK